jgi:hypothetical protein
MNRFVFGICAAFTLASGSALAKGQPLAGHPNLQAAHAQIRHAMERISAAQKANEFDMGGHAAKAKELLEQAEKELMQAAGAASEGRR